MRFPAIFACFALVFVTACERRADGSDSAEGWGAKALAKAQEVNPQLSRQPEPEPEPPVEALPIVTLDGVTHPHPVTLVSAGPRVYSRSLRSWIFERPDRRSDRLGYLRVGGSAPVAGQIVSGSGCAKGWQPIEPRGYVCLGKRATLDEKDPAVSAVQEHPPEFGRKLPYIYGTVRNPGPIFAKLPTDEQLKEHEPDVRERMPRWLDAEGEIGASYAQDVWLGHAGDPPDPRVAWDEQLTRGLPPFLMDGNVMPMLSGKTRDATALRIGTMLPKAGHAFLQTFFWQGRRYGINTRLEIFPTDRLRPIRGSDFHGVEIGKDVDFPFAFVRGVGARYHDGSQADYRAVLALTGKQRFYDEVLHYETKDGKWISDRVASRLDPAKRMPGWGVKGEKWIDVNLTKQTLMLYEGTEPVFATLISSGEAGLEDAETTTATKRGIFRIHTKHVTATMSSREIGEEFELQDVPYVMYFDKEGYALHGAYWHDRFGTPKSHGCINLAPEDARRIFHWTEPRLPLGWHGVLLPLKGTVVFVHP